MDESISLDDHEDGKRYAVRHDVAFVAQYTGNDDWHGYPEAWDKVPQRITGKWLKDGKIRRRDLKKYKTREQLRSEFGGSL